MMGAELGTDSMLQELGLSAATSWSLTLLFALGGLAATLAFTPIADRLATRVTSSPLRLGAFRAIQQSKTKLVAGIVIAWILGGFLEEIVFRAIVLRWIEGQAATWLPMWSASAVAIILAAIGAGIIHLYQGPRGALIVTQLSLLFGLTYVLSGYSLWAVIFAHGSYDTIAFMRFASGRSAYARS